MDIQSPEEKAAPDQDEDTEHLTDVEDGAGCVEIWEHLSETRASD